MRHANISIFVPHLGCPNDCSFCNQRSITGHTDQPTEKSVIDSVETAMKSPRFDSENTEIAFFGGSFTAIQTDYMISLLRAAYSFVKDKKVKGIRISTRPDCIDDSILKVLKEYGVTAIELGAQSMDDSVLQANDRGHYAQDVINASRLIKQYGFELGLQMMTGLYTDTFEKSVLTAEKLSELRPDTVRIYPTVVLKNTRLADLYKQGIYKPQSLKDAVSLCCELLDFFEKKGINVIRTGLHSIDEEAFVAGPWHPAFSELCDSKRIYKKIISNCQKNVFYEVSVNPSDISKAVGQQKSNLNTLLREGYKIKFIQDINVKIDSISIKEVK